MLNLKKVIAFFVREGYKWRFANGDYRVPTAEEIDTEVITAMHRLSDQPDLSLLEVGRLIVQKNGSHYDVYVHIAEVSDDDL